VYDNIRRFLQFQLSVNVVALFSCLIGSLAFVKSPLSPIQLLWVNLIMDSLASLALATETPKPDLLMRPPYRRNEYIISRKMVKHILGQAIFQSIVILTILFAGDQFIAEAFCDKDSDYVGKTGGDYCGAATTEALDFVKIKELLTN
jgi:Ca2+ transporting ATPase